MVSDTGNTGPLGEVETKPKTIQAVVTRKLPLLISTPPPKLSPFASVSSQSWI